MRPFRIVTHRNWLAEQFKDFGAVQDFGFDINPATARETLWWAPGAWVASAAKAGVVLPLMSCGPTWLDALPYKYRGRPVITMPLPRLTNDEPNPSFVKLPEAKLDSCPAKLYYTSRLADTWQQFQQMIFMTEARLFIAHGEVVASSLYLHHDWIWGADGWPDPPLLEPLVRMKMMKITRFAELVLADPEVKCPPGFVLDIGITSEGNPKVIEANAAWSSSPYDCDPAGVVKAIEASHDFAGEYPQWAWQPNPVFDKVGPLRIESR